MNRPEVIDIYGLGATTVLAENFQAIVCTGEHQHNSYDPLDWRACTCHIQDCMFDYHASDSFDLLLLVHTQNRLRLAHTLQLLTGNAANL